MIKNSLIALATILSLSAVPAMAAPLIESHTAVQIVRGQPDQLPKLCDLNTIPYRNGHEILGCYNPNRNTMAISVGMTNSEFNNVYDHLSAASKDGKTLVIRGQLNASPGYDYVYEQPTFLPGFYAGVHTPGFNARVGF